MEVKGGAWEAEIRKKLKRKEIMITETRKKLKRKKSEFIYRDYVIRHS